MHPPAQVDLQSRNVNTTWAAQAQQLLGACLALRIWLKSKTLSSWFPSGSQTGSSKRSKTSRCLRTWQNLISVATCYFKMSQSWKSFLFLRNLICLTIRLKIFMSFLQLLNSSMSATTKSKQWPMKLPLSWRIWARLTYAITSLKTFKTFQFSKD